MTTWRPATMPFSPPVIDLHQDLLGHIDAREAFGDELQTSWETIEASPVRLVVASSFAMDRSVEPASSHSNDHSLNYFRRYREIVRDRRGWHLVLNASDVDRALTNSRGILLHVEGLGATSPEDAPQLLDELFSAGCRSIGPVWNESNGLAHGPSQPRDGLTKLGRHVIQIIDEQAFVLDLAHMSIRSFWDTLDVTAGPVLVSHANARALADHPRNLTDDQARAIAKRAGVIGVVFSSVFAGQPKAARVVDHIEYLADLVGTEHVAIGSDLGGLWSDSIPDLGDVTRVGVIAAELEKRGWETSAIEMVTWGNASRVLRASLAKTEDD